MARFGLLFLAAGALAATDMGPAGFMWPPDRSWSAATDNTGPCGTNDGVGAREKFPLTQGKISLVAQDDSYHTQVSISFKNDPKVQSDFSVIVDESRIVELDPGHTCVKVPDAPLGVSVGSNATLQIMYIADFDRPENQTFFACADITYVELANFVDPLRCFNASDSENDVPAPTATGAPVVNPGHTIAPSSAPAAASNKLSGGAIAGIVVGVVAGLALLGAAGFFVYRSRKQNHRLVRQRDSRLGKWADDQPGKDSTSQNSIRLQNVDATPASR